MASKILFLLKIMQKVLWVFFSFWKNLFLLREVYMYNVNLRHRQKFLDYRNWFSFLNTCLQTLESLETLLCTWSVWFHTSILTRWQCAAVPIEVGMTSAPTRSQWGKGDTNQVLRWQTHLAAWVTQGLFSFAVSPRGMGRLGWGKHGPRV